MREELKRVCAEPVIVGVVTKQQQGHQAVDKNNKFYKADFFFHNSFESLQIRSPASDVVELTFYQCFEDFCFDIKIFKNSDTKRRAPDLQARINNIFADPLRRRGLPPAPYSR